MQSYGRDLLEKEFIAPETVFKYLIIPGGIPSPGGKTPDLKKMPYEEAMDYFGLDY